MGIEWNADPNSEHLYVSVDRATGEERWRATAVDLAIGANAELRAIAEVYAADDGEERFLRDFVAAWHTVMMADRCDLEVAAPTACEDPALPWPSRPRRPSPSLSGEVRVRSPPQWRLRWPPGSPLW